jgi:hypothetical protein
MTTKQAVERLNSMIEKCEEFEWTLLGDYSEDARVELHDVEVELEALRMAVRALKSKPRWIPCKERLPEMHKDEFEDDMLRVSDVVLVSDAGRVLTGCCVRFNKKLHWETYDGLVCEDVNAWMPLPEVYSEED